MIIKTKSPVRISFGSSGDSTYYLNHIGRGNSLGATINKYSYVELHPRKDDKIILRSLETGEMAEFNSTGEITLDKRELNIMKAVVKHFGNKGIEIITYTDIPVESGLGGSAAHAVSLIKAFAELNKIQMSEEDIAKLAYHLERNVLGIEGGYQDQWLSTHRGFHYLQYTITKDGINPVHVEMRPVKLSEKGLQTLERSLILVRIPREKSGREIHLEQRDRSKESIAILNMKYANIESIRDHIENGEFDKIGELFNIDWKIKKQLAPSMTSPFIDEINDLILHTGAIGARIIGSGAGGSMLVYCPPYKREDVLNALKKFNVSEISFKFEKYANNKGTLVEQIHKRIHEHHQTIEQILNNDDAKTLIETITIKIIESYKNGGKLIVFGNGGSAADAQHIVGELVNKINIDRPMLNAISLTTNTSIITAISNDSDYSDVFARQIESLADDKDVVIGISTSGKAENVLRALKKARERGSYVVYFTGKTGGRISTLLENDGTIDISLKIPSDYTPIIQEAHIMAGHIICELVEHELYGK